MTQTSPVEPCGSRHASDNELLIRAGTADDIPAIKAIADREKHALGFVHRGSLARSVERDELIVANVGMSVVGFCQFYRRQNGTVTLNHVAVASETRGQGIGRALLAHLYCNAADHGMTGVRLKCPTDLPSNEFYLRNGFSLVGIEDKDARPLNVWELQLPSAQTGFGRTQPS